MNKELFYRNLKAKRTQPLGELMKKFLNSSKVNENISEALLQKAWKDIVGEVVAKYTDSIEIKENKVILRISSAPLRNEMLMSKRMLLSSIHCELGNEKIKDIIFV